MFYSPTAGFEALITRLCALFNQRGRSLYETHQVLAQQCRTSSLNVHLDTIKIIVSECFSPQQQDLEP